MNAKRSATRGLGTRGKTREFDWLLGLLALLGLLFFLESNCQAQTLGTIVTNQDGSITATSAPLSCTFTLAKYAGLDSLHRICHQGSDTVDVGDSPVTAQGPMSTYVGSLTYVSWSSVKQPTGPNIWIIVANGTAASGTFPVPGPLSIGTKQADGTCSIWTPAFRLAVSHLDSDPTANCLR